MSCSERIVTVVLKSADVLGASQDLADVVPFELRGSGHFSINLTVDNGAGGSATDSPHGRLELYSSADGVEYANLQTLPILGNVPGYSGLTDVSLVLAKLISESSIMTTPKRVALTFPGDAFPGRFIKIRYVRISGGGGDSRLSIAATTW